ncbi:hypothetical protein HDU82_001531 [Entophlyctis luteolus]|nr:hypothetical protein HDU82_001531 [Entophlyctis luteolus]
MSVDKENMTASAWSGFHKKALRERQNQLRLVYPALFSQHPLPPTQQHPVSVPSYSHSLQDPRASPSAASSASSSLAYDSTSSLVGLDAASAPDVAPFPITGLDEKIADNMIENCVGTMGLPVGLALNFVINGNPTIIPMVVEEPSVVAAVSGAAKTICSASCNRDGFTATTSERNVIFAQVVIMDIKDVAAAAEIIQSKASDAINIANSFVPNMVSRGGGVISVTVRTPPRKSVSKRARRKLEVPVVDDLGAQSWLVVHLHLDVCDAMGANAASTVAEGVAPFLADWVGGRIGLRIVSNLCVERIAQSSFRIPLSKLSYKSFNGRQVASRMIEALEWAQDDPFRATTHNKGIMNGIDAVAVATGQDWRAIEASAHAWASGCGQADERNYRPLTHYWVDSDSGVLTEGDDGLYFCGDMDMPISVGTRGGVLKTNPVYNYTLGLMGFPDSKQLAMAMVSVGLAQNFAALRALTTEGIQRGHMSLHARNIAIAAGAPPHAINDCVAYMVESNRVNQTIAKEYLVAHEIHSTLATANESMSDPKHPPRAPSTFYIELPLAQSPEPITLNIAFETVGDKPVHLAIGPTTTSPPSSVFKSLFNPRFDFDWISSTVAMLDTVELNAVPEFPARKGNKLLVKKLKVLSILMNILLRSMMAQWPAETKRLVDKIVKLAVAGGRVDSGFAKRTGVLGHQMRSRTNDDVLKQPPAALQVGRPLLLALWQVFELRVLQWVGHEPLVNVLLESQLEVLKALTKMESQEEHSSAGPNRISPLSKQLFKSTDEERTSSGEDDEPLTMKKKIAFSAPPASADQAVKDTHALLARQSRRFQYAVFMLCDANSLDVNLLTPARLRVLKAAGDVVSWEQMCCHDVSAPRLARDLSAQIFHSGTPANGFSEMLRLHDAANGAPVELELVTKDPNSFVFWLFSTLGPLAFGKLLADALDASTPEFSAFAASLRQGDQPTISKKSVLAALTAVDLHQVFRSQIASFLELFSKEKVFVAMIRSEKELDIFDKSSLLGITRAFHKYYGLESFFSTNE